MNRYFYSVIASLLLVLSGPAAAQGDVAAGKAAYTTCAACHGASAEGNAALKAPRLNHLSATYLGAQLDKFKTGVRGGEGATDTARQMAPMAATLANAQAVADVAAFITSLESASPVVSVEGDAKMGGDYYNQFCGACHGAAGQGNPALNSPRLAGTSDWYLLAQLQAFRTGARGAHPEDRTGRQMRAMAAVLPGDQAVADVVAFIATLQP